MWKVNSEKELLKILKIVAEESVLSAKKRLNENNDPAQYKYKKAVEYDESIYGKIVKEQDDVEEEDQDADDAADDEEAEDTETNDTDDSDVDDNEEDEEAEEEDFEEESEDLEPSEFGADFENVLKDLNNLRAGKSTKNKEIREELESYFKRLDNNERKVLHLFIYELSDILKGSTTGDDAQDPGEPPFSLTIAGESEPDEKSSIEKVSKQQKPAKDSQAGLEDTTPPIKVNERQDLHEIRKKVKRLMKRY